MLLKRVLFFCVVSLLSVGVANAGSTGFTEGVEYKLVRPVQPTTTGPGQVEVTELFWYGCPHCNTLEPHLQNWKKNKPENAVLVRLPAQFRPVWAVHAGAYYVAQLLGIEDKVHQAFFDELHKKRKRLNSIEATAAFFERFGVTRTKFMEIYNSFAVKTRLSQADRKMRNYGANSVPTLIINGKYRTDVTMNGGSYEKLFRLVNYLIEKETKETQAAR